MKKKVKNKVKSNKLADTVLVQSLADFGDAAMRVYGQKTNEDRSVPDMYDGCKPVQRRLLQACIDVGAKSRASMVKTARVVGTTLGKYHPHGDLAVAGAIETMVNSSTTLIEGKGNWGDPIHGDSAAAMRYTNCRLSRFSEAVFFDPRMLAVSQTIPNYDDKDTEVYVLPARLPNAIINGNMGIGVGLTTDTPSFSARSVLAALKHALTTWSKSGSQITALECRKLLKFNYPQFGGQAYLEGSYLAGFKTLSSKGEGDILFGPKQMAATLNKSEGSFVVNEFGPDLNLDKALEKLREKPWFVKLEDQTGMENGTRPQYKIFAKKSGTWSTVLDDAYYLFSTTKRFKINLTVRTLQPDSKTDGKLVENITMRRFSLVTFLNEWLTRRIELEKLALAQEIADNKRESRLTEVRILASAKLDFIFKVLKSGLDFSGMAKKIAAGLKIKMDEAEYILRMQVYRLSKLDGDQEKKRLADLKTKRKTLDKLLANPSKAVAADLDRLEKELGL